MNIWYQPSRAKKGSKKNTKQAYLRWYENRKPYTKKLEGLYLYTGRGLDDFQKRHNKRAEIDLSEILAQKKRELNDGRFNIDGWDKKGKSFVRFGKEYIDNLDLSNKSKAVYIQALKLFEDYFGKDKQIHSITKSDVTNFKIEMRDNVKSRYNLPYELNTINTYNNRLKLIYQEAQSDANILTGINHFKNGYLQVDDSRGEYINVEEFAQLDYNMCQNTDVAKAFMFSWLTGLRKSDIEKLKWKDVQKDEMGTHITITQDKTGKRVRVALSDEHMEILGKRNADHMRLIPFVLTTTNNGYLNVWLAQNFPNKKIGQQRGRDGIKGLTFHSARASFITNYLMNGVAPTRVQTYVGHKDLKTTLSYYRGSTEMQEQDTLMMDTKIKEAKHLHLTKSLL